MTDKQEKRILFIMRLYLRTFPPHSKNGNGIIGSIKRALLMIPLNIVTGGDLDKVEEAFNRFEQKHVLTD